MRAQCRILRDVVEGGRHDGFEGNLGRYQLIDPQELEVISNTS